MNEQERRQLLEQLKGLGHPEDVDLPSLRLRLAERFLPLPAHTLALRPECILIRGGRGAGKSTFHHLLQALDSRDEPAALWRLFHAPVLPAARWVDAFSLVWHHPPGVALDALAEQADDMALRAFWMVHLLARLEALGMPASLPTQIAESRAGHESAPAAWIHVARQNIGAVAAALDEAERHLSTAGTTVFALYDDLDRIGLFKSGARRRYISALLSLWLSLSSRYRHLRPKLFLREDLFEEAQSDLTDAGRLRSRSVPLDWDMASLYWLLVRHMASLSPEMRVWLSGVEGLELEEVTGLGWMPGEMSDRVQKALIDRLAGEIMGRGVEKGYTWRWIPNRLQDAQARVAPRTLLALIGFAAEHALNRHLSAGEQLLHAQDLQAALGSASLARLGEPREEYPSVQRLANLASLYVPLERHRVVELLSAPAAGEEDSVGGPAVFDELLRLGVLKPWDDDRVDVPDIYRHGYGIIRKIGAGRFG